MEFTVTKLEHLKEVAEKWVENHRDPCVTLVNGQMGAGKTTFIKELCQALGVTENITSPTFSLVNQYKGENGVNVYHFDLYRVKEEEELFDLGFEEYLDGSAYVFIEWPEIGESFYSGIEKHINLEVNEEVRTITWT